MSKHVPTFEELKRTYDAIMGAAVASFNESDGEKDLAEALFIVDIQPGDERVRVQEMPPHMLLPFYEADSRDQLARQQHILARMIRSMLEAPCGPGESPAPNAVYVVTHSITVLADSPDRTGKPRELAEWEGAREVIACHVHTLNGTFLGHSEISESKPRRATKGELRPGLLHGSITMTAPEQRREALH